MGPSQVEEPAGAEGPPCCMVNRTLYKVRQRVRDGAPLPGHQDAAAAHPLPPQVNVDTASGNRGGGEEGGGHELALEGLKDPHNFKSLVTWQG